MPSVRRAVLSILIVSLAVLALPAAAQRVIATVPVGLSPRYPAVNSVTNKIYVANYCGNGGLVIPRPYSVILNFVQDDGLFES